MSLKLSGTQLGNITGGPSSLNLYELADVSISAPVTGQYLRYNSTISEWQNSVINTEVYNFLNTNLITPVQSGIVLTKVSGPQTVSLSLDITAVGDASGVLSAPVGPGPFPPQQGEISLTLATVNANVGTFGSASTIPVVTVNAKGLITAVTQTAFTGTAPLATSLAGGLTGELPYQSATGVTSFLSPGTTSQVLVGSPTAPSWSNTPTLTGTNFTGIPNGALTNSSLTLGSTNMALGSTTTTVAGLTSVTSTTFVGALTGNASTATIAANITSGAAGSLPYQSAASTTTMLAAGTSSQVLVSGATPGWTNTPTLTGTNFTGVPNGALTNNSLTIGSTNIALGATSITLAGLTSVTSTSFVGALTGNASSATNIAGGAAGSLPYQTGSSATSLLAAGTSSQVLVSGATPGWTNTPVLTGTNFTGIPNGALTNNSLTIGSTNIALGATSTTLAGLTSVTSTTFVGALTGNASTATTLATGRTISISTDATGTSASFDGSGNATIPMTLATVNASPQTDTFRKITVNGKGLTTATSAVTSGDITTALGYTPVNVAGDTMTGFLILNANPTAALGAVTKQYVDAVSAGLNVHASCVTATTATLASSSGNTVTYNNGTGGVGATLTTTGSFATIGGFAVPDTSRVLVKSEATQANNGIYVKDSNTQLTRATDFDNSPPGEIASGDFTFIVSGTVAGTNWAMTTPGTITVGTTAIVFSQLSGPGVYTAGTGIDITTNIISNTGVLSNVAGTGISVSGATGNVTITNNGVTSVAGTANQIAVSGATGAVTFSLPSSVTIGGTMTAGTFSGAGTSLTGTAASLSIGGNAATATTATTANALNPANNYTMLNNLAFTGTGQVASADAVYGMKFRPSADGSSYSHLWMNSAGSGLMFLSPSGALTTAAGIIATGVISGTSFSGSGSGLTSIPNGALTNSSLTIGSTNIALGATSTTLAGLSSVTSTTFVGSLSGNATTATSATTATTATNLSGGSVNGTTVTLSGLITTKTPTNYTAITSTTYNTGVIEIPQLVVPNSGTNFVPFLHGSTVLNGAGYVGHVTLGALRVGPNSFAGGGGMFIGLSQADANPTEYFTLQTGGNISHSSGTTFLNSSNYNSYSPTLTGGGASGTWGINITGNAVTLGGLALSAGTNNQVNQVVRTNSSGYCDFGWINTVSGDNGVTAPDRIYASSDAYLRYYTPTNFRTVMGLGALTTANSWTGANQFYSTSSTAAGSNPGLQASSTSGNGAYMAFHRNGLYAVNMGLDTDNVLRIGGWSAPANVLQLDMSGNLTVNGNYNVVNFGLGLTGLYDSTKYQNVFSMGASYRPSADGTSIASSYGIVWTHTNVGGQSKAGLAHQALFTNAGVTQTAIGTGIWTNGTITSATSGTGIAFSNGNKIQNNTSTYGALEVTGAQSSYSGFYLTNGGGVTLGMYDSGGNGGAYDATSGWHFYWLRANTCLGIGGSSTAAGYKAYINGALYASGDITAFSDRRVKDNIQTVEMGLDKVLRLRGVTYFRNDNGDLEKGKRSVGVVAQEVEEVMPELVHTNLETGMKGVNYGNMVALLIEAVKELNAKVETLKAEIATLKA